jgi:hypothetical protein
MWVAEVENQGARKQIIVTDSLRFSLLKECRLHSLGGTKNNWFVIGAHLQDTKHGKDQKLYWSQYKLKHTDAQDQVQLKDQKKEEPQGSSEQAKIDVAFEERVIKE